MRSQRWLHIIPVATVMYMIAYIDRTNISLALPSISKTLHMNPTQAGDAAGVFFWGYVFLSVPGGYLAQRWSAKRFVAIMLCLWGISAVGCGLVHTGRQFWVMRLLLGGGQGGVWPAVLVLLSHWFPRGERARANAYWMLCIPISLILSSPLSGWILGRWNWRVLVISEGALPFFWLVVWWMVIDDNPQQARWISTEERTYLETILEEESRKLDSAEPSAFWRLALNPFVLMLAAIYMLHNFGNYGLLFWLPSALQHARKMSSVLVGILYTFPFIASMVGMVLISRHSDKRRERRGHVAFGFAWGGICMITSALLVPYSPILSFMAVSLAGAGDRGILGPFWAIPTETLPRSVCGPVMGLVNAVGNLGGYFGPLVVGYVYHRTGDFRYAFGVLGLGFLLGTTLTLLLPRQVASREKLT